MITCIFFITITGLFCFCFLFFKKNTDCIDRDNANQNLVNWLESEGYSEFTLGAFQILQSIVS